MESNNTQNTHLNQSPSDQFRAELAQIQQNNSTTIENEAPTTSNDNMTEPHVQNDITVENEQMEVSENTEGESKEIDFDEDNLPNMIPRGRFKKVIEKRKELEAQLQLDRERLAKAQAEIQLYNQALQKITGQNTSNAPEETPFEPLDKEADNVYMKMINETKSELNAMKMHTMVTQQEAEFSKANPDFEKAYDYLLTAQTKANNLLFENEQQAKEAALNQMRYIATQGLQQGKNVASMFYNMAKNYGYAAPNKTPTPNLEAIANNMKKSSVANVNTTSLEFNGGSNYTKLENFDKAYDCKPDTFHKMLNALKANR